MHIQVKREAQTVSVSELPLVLGLFFVGPVELVVARVVGSLLVFVLHRRSSPLKVLFNTALVTAETCTALLIFHLVAGDLVQIDAREWVSGLRRGTDGQRVRCGGSQPGDRRLRGAAERSGGGPGGRPRPTLRPPGGHPGTGGREQLCGGPRQRVPPGGRGRRAGPGLPGLCRTRGPPPRPRAPLPLQPGGHQQPGFRRAAPERAGAGVRDHDE